MADDRAVRAAYAAAAPADHLDDETWIRVASGRTTAEERARAVAHIARCPECMHLFRALRSAPDVEPVAHGRRAAAPRSWLAAAASLAAVALAWLAIGAPPAPPRETAGLAANALDPLRSAGSETGPALVSPSGRVSGPVVFEWRPLPGALGYRVAIYRATSDTLWTSPSVTTTRLAWPDHLPTSTGRYYWQVIAAMPGGERVSRLKVFDLTP